MTGHFFPKTLYIKMTFTLEYACQKETPARVQSDVRLFLSAYVRHLQTGSGDLTSQWPPHRPVLQAGGQRSQSPSSASSFFKNEFIMNGVAVTGEYRADATASVHTVCSGICGFVLCFTF